MVQKTENWKGGQNCEDYENNCLPRIIAREENNHCAKTTTTMITSLAKGNVTDTQIIHTIVWS